MIDEESLKNIENLHRLKSEGIITEEEFERSKEKILFGSRPSTALPLAGVSDFNPNEPLHWMTLPLRRYTDYQGRSCRKEYWMFQIIQVAMLLIAVVFVAADKPEYSDELGTIGKFAVAMLFLGMLALAVPGLPLTIRRFHDQDKSGWFALLACIPYVGPIALLVFMCIEGTRGDNRFGADPRRA